MTKENEVKVLTDMVADFVAHIGKKLPDDVVAKLEELGSQESAALPKVLYETMTKNQGLAVELNRPSCQDTGVLQFWLKCDLTEALKDFNTGKGESLTLGGTLVETPEGMEVDGAEINGWGEVKGDDVNADL